MEARMTRTAAVDRHCFTSQLVLLDARAVAPSTVLTVLRARLHHDRGRAVLGSCRSRPGDVINQQREALYCPKPGGDG